MRRVHHVAARRGLSPAALQRVAEAVVPHGRVARYRPLRGGVSGSVFIVYVEVPDGPTRSVVLRRYDAPWHGDDPLRCTREFRTLAMLAKHQFPAPRPLMLDQDGASFGAPTVVMSRLPGRPRLQPAGVDGYVRQLAETLAPLHGLPVEDFDFLPDGTLALTQTLDARRVADDPIEPSLRQAVLARWPGVAACSAPQVVQHTDYWPGNVLWRRGRLTGVVDWEDVRLGDPSRDVAICRGDLSLLFGLDVADAFAEQYERIVGRALTNLPFWDLVTCTLALAEVDHWVPGWRALGRYDLTVEVARARLRSLAQRSL